jgi:hypothetical protein
VKRPALNDASFLAHIFHPKKQPIPTGLRKSKIVGLAGRKKTRVAAYNRMSAVNQEILKRSGNRDAYLAGTTSLAEAKRALRPSAVAQGVAKPLKARVRITPISRGSLTTLDKQIAAHLKRTIRAAGKHVNEATVDREIQYLDPPEQQMMGWDYGRIKHAGRRHSEYETFVDGKVHNPFWYH